MAFQDEKKCDTCGDKVATTRCFDCPHDHRSCDDCSCEDWQNYCKKSDSAEDSDDWEQVYSHWYDEAGCLFHDKDSFYETYGGGPSGGYVVHAGCQIQTWHQTWGTEKTYKDLVGKMLEFKVEDGIEYCRVVEKEDEDEPADDKQDILKTDGRSNYSDKSEQIQIK